MSQNSLLKIPTGAKVLVTGATGFTGAWLLRKLVRCGAQVRAIAREKSNLAPLASEPVEWFRGNVYDGDLVKAAVRDIDFIFHVAAAFREAKIQDEEYRRVHVLSTQLLAQAAASTPGFKRMVHVSTMGVHGHIKTPPGTETSPFAPGDIYQVTKLEAELWLHEYAREHGLPYTVIRPMAIYGPGDRRLLKVFKMPFLPLIPVLGYGKCLYHLIHVDDLTDAMIHAALHPAAQGEAFLIGNREAIRLADMLRIIAGEYHRPCRIVRLPVTPFFLAADLCEAVCRPLGVEPPLYRRRVAFYTKDRSFDTSKMRETLGFEPRYSNEDGLIQTARWYVGNGWIRLDKTGPAPL